MRQFILRVCSLSLGMCCSFLNFYSQLFSKPVEIRVFHLSQVSITLFSSSSIPKLILALMQTKGSPCSQPICLSSCFRRQFLALQRQGYFTASHLLTAITTGLPSFITDLMRSKSSKTIEEQASITQITTWLYLTCAMVLICTLRRCSSSVLSKLGVLMPAVSISSIFLSLYSRRARILSLVVWGMEDTTTFYSPKSSLIKVDLPTFGLPIKQILMIPFNLGFRASAPRLFEKASSGLTKNSSKFQPSRSQLSAGLGLILLKSVSHWPALKPLSADIFYISALNFFTSSQNFSSLAFRFNSKDYFIS